MYNGHIHAASNRADLKFQCRLVDPTTNDYVDLTGATITVALRQVGKITPILTGTNADSHVTVVDPQGVFEVWFTRAEMVNFPPGDMDIGIVVRLADGITHQLVAGTLPVVDGVVAA